MSDEESDAEDEENEGRRKRKRYDDEFLAKREKKRQWEENRRQLLFDYYEFTFHGSSVSALRYRFSPFALVNLKSSGADHLLLLTSMQTSLLMFELAWKMTKDSNELLWWASVGLSEMLINGKMARSAYALELARIKPHVLRLNPQLPPSVLEAEGNNGRRNSAKGIQICVEREWVEVPKSPASVIAGQHVLVTA
jgi:cell division control protein 45